ncbi:MAG: aminotransferase class III-fold pyridoxal phosphate-dependent enzyme, partial [Armatimonadetes bacterium]|nr:aminotransferase class III-fold pyridoxal phosphate-dependent enzyme [Armatimonadota bacterium]
MSKRPTSFALGAMPVYLERGSGCRVWDVDGNEYVDFISSLGPITLCYCYPAVDDAVREQLEKGTIFSMMSPLEVEAARAVIECVPCAEMVRFLKTGAEGTAAAARIARGYTGRDLIVSSGYHGWLDTWAVANNPPSDRGVPKCLRESIATFAFGAFEGDNCLEAVMDRHKGRVAAIVLEPVSYSNTDSADFLCFTTDSVDFLCCARQLADKHDALLVYDEIVSGFRVALGGAQEHFGVVPDIAVFAKGISNGFPIAAVAGRQDVMQVAAELVISSTYGGEALSLAAVVACLREYREKDVIPHLWAMGDRLISGANRIAEEAGLALTFRGWPVMSSYAFGYDAQTNQALMTLLLQEMAKRGVLLRRGGLNFITYSHKTEDIDQTLAACAEVFPILKDAVDSGNIADLLITREVAEGIRRF